MEYNVRVETGSSGFSGTMNSVSITLVGERGESEPTLLDNLGRDLNRGAVGAYTVRSDSPLGPILLVRLEKQKYLLEDNWFCSTVCVTVPGDAVTLTFPCYRWLVGDTKVEIREGTAKKPNDDRLPLVLAHRKAELQERQEMYRWQLWTSGVPKCTDVETEADLPLDARFSDEKRSDFERALQYALAELCLKQLALKFGDTWDDLDDFKRTFWCLRSPAAEYTMEHWKDDLFFAYQFLNGSNPRMIQRCMKLPSRFPVSEDMVQAFLAPNTTLKEELKAGNMYLVDYAILDGVPANTVREQLQHVAAPLCLLCDHPERGLNPIAIQLEQNPSQEALIFLPSDPPLTWLLAKIWVSHADFQIFQVLSHLLRTHLWVEVFCVATLRQLPAVHPIYKLLAPHLKYTLEINARGRLQILSPSGIFERCTSIGAEGILVLTQREYKTLTYRSFQPHLDFQDRGVMKLRDYFYRDHAMMMWDVIQSFVSGIVSLYYRGDSDVAQDSELQAWIKDVVTEGFAEIPQFGLPSELKSKEELSTLLTVVIFTCSGQHAAINNGQFDWCAWVPNCPCSMRQPPPTNKDAPTMQLIMNSLPDISQSCLQMAITWHLGRAQPDAIPLGRYLERHFTEPRAQELIDQFQQDLKGMEEKILRETKGLELPYLFLCPSRVENSITT